MNCWAPAVAHASFDVELPQDNSADEDEQTHNFDCTQRPVVRPIEPAVIAVDPLSELGEETHFGYT
jgi:hypothetical protein